MEIALLLCNAYHYVTIIIIIIYIYIYIYICIQVFLSVYQEVLYLGNYNGKY